MRPTSERPGRERIGPRFRVAPFCDSTRRRRTPLDSSRHPRARGPATAALACLSLLWGYNWVAMKAALAHASPIDIAAWRFLIAGLGFVPVIRWMGLSLRVPRSEWLLTAMLSVLFTLNFTCMFSALSLGAAGRTAVLVYTMPFWVVLLAHVFLGERMRPVQWFAVGLAGAGLVLLVDPLHVAGVLPNLLALAAGLSWGASVVVTKRVQGRTRAPLLTLTLWQMLIASALLFGAGFAFGTRSTEWTSGFVLALGFTSILATNVAWLLFYFALERLSAGVTGLGTLATPVLGVLLAWLHFGERPKLMEAAAMGLIVAGIALLMVPSARRQPP